MVSFVIPAHNESPQIGRTLAAIRAAAREGLAPAGVGYEVIVVDDDSSDTTGLIARAAGARVERVALRKIGAVRNAGARAARGDVIIFVDADTEVSGALVRAAMERVRGGAVGCGALGVWREEAPWWGDLVLWTWNRVSRLTRTAAGAFFVVRRADFEAVGGFDPAYYCGEEVALSRALRKRGAFGVLPDRYRTSARKVTNYGFWESLRTMVRLMRAGERGFTNPEGKELWYQRRDVRAAR